MSNHLRPSPVVFQFTTVAINASANIVIEVTEFHTPTLRTRLWTFYVLGTFWASYLPQNVPKIQWSSKENACGHTLKQPTATKCLWRKISPGTFGGSTQSLPINRHGKRRHWQVSAFSVFIQEINTEPFNWCGVGMFRVDARFYPTDVGWNLALTRNSPTPTDAVICHPDMNGASGGHRVLIQRASHLLARSNEPACNIVLHWLGQEPINTAPLLAWTHVNNPDPWLHTQHTACNVSVFMPVAAPNQCPSHPIAIKQAFDEAEVRDNFVGWNHCMELN